MLLERITSPDDIKALDASELPQLCREIRQAVLTSSAAVGGHIGSNLGVVELTCAMHRVFNSPRDQFVFDVSHQIYPHKMLTGRAAYYLDPKLFGRLSGFSNPAESEHDLFSMGHTSTSISLACGLAKARDLAGDDHDVIAVIGDGSLSGGLAFEGFDALAELGSGVIIIVNDNGWSIAENHGGIYRNLADLRASEGRAEHNFFRALGLEYRFLREGNDVFALETALRDLQGTDHPVVLHICTEKGAGYQPALADAEGWHHVGPFELAATNDREHDAAPAQTPDADKPAQAPADESAPITYAELTGRHLAKRMAVDPALVVVSAATPYIMGFTPERRAAAGRQFVDVGIAEEHAVTYVTALSRAGAKPVLGLYGVFMQRAYDELWHDLCLNNAPAVLLDFGASVFGTTDAAHLSFFDLALLGGLPNLRCLAPTCGEEYLDMLAWAIDYTGGPVVIRVPVGTTTDVHAPRPAADAFDNPRYKVARSGSQVAILALGTFFELGQRIADELERAHGIHATLINPQFATELDTELLDSLPMHHRCVITLEDGVLEGGWGEKVARHLGPRKLAVQCYGIHKGFPDRVPAHDLLATCGTTMESIVADILAMLE